MAASPRTSAGEASARPVPVLLYHSVSDSPAPEIADYTVSPRIFAEQLDAIAASGREAVTFSELVRRLSAGEAEALENSVCVTFDDGWRDNIEAASALAERAIPATVFVTSGFVGERGYLSASQLAELAAVPGIEIGAHSRSHPRLDELPESALADQIAGSGAALAELTGRPVTTFAYPHGNYDARVLAATKAAGYTGAAAVKNAFSHAGDDPFAVARWMFTSQTDKSEIEQLLAGHGAPLAWSGERLRTRGYRALRRARRKLGR